MTYRPGGSDFIQPQSVGTITPMEQDSLTRELISSLQDKTFIAQVASSIPNIVPEQFGFPGLMLIGDHGVDPPPASGNKKVEHILAALGENKERFPEGVNKARLIELEREIFSGDMTDVQKFVDSFKGDQAEFLKYAAALQADLKLVGITVIGATIGKDDVSLGLKLENDKGSLQLFVHSDGTTNAAEAGPSPWVPNAHDVKPEQALTDISQMVLATVQ